MPAHDWNRFWQEIDAKPNEFVAHKLPNQAVHPCWTPSGSRSQPVTLRAFALGQDKVSPCALAWTGSSASLPSAQTTDRVKDVWILRSSATNGHGRPRAGRGSAQAVAPDQPAWPSRSSGWAATPSAAEVTTRILRIVQQQAWPLTESATARHRRPLWAAMAAISGHAADFFVKPTRDAVKPEGDSVLLPARTGATAARCSPTCNRVDRTPKISASISRPRSGRCSIIFTSRSRCTPTRSRCTPTKARPNASASSWRTARCTRTFSPSSTN